ncbi:MAG: hypothetical protein ACK5Q5_00595 [Planctomycetaceae bacterium]
MGVSDDGFGGGTGGAIGSFHDRADFDAMALWEIRKLGIGERAARQTVCSQLEQVTFQQVGLMDRIACEVAEAVAQCQSRQQQVQVAERAISNAEASSERHINRIRRGQRLPIESLQSIPARAAACREYLSAVMDDNEAQFRLQRAPGWPVC